MIARLLLAFRPRSFAGATAAGRFEAGRPADIAAPRAALGNIQVMRGVAATMVLVDHTVGHSFMQRGTWEATWGLDEVAGIVGVAIFFAISGYLMAGLVRRDDPWRFLAHRVVRIFPTYLAVVALFALLFASLRTPFSINVFALTLAPTGPRTYPLGVEWTLFYEMSFYVGLFLLACAGLVSRLVPIALAWLAVLALALFVLVQTPAGAMTPAPYLLPFSPACVAFAGGLLLPALVARGWIRPWLVWPALALILACIPFEADIRRWLGGIAAVLLIGTAVAGRQVSRERAFWRGAIAFGDWSYVLYLVHVPAILLVLRYAPENASGPLLWVCAILVALGLTALLGPLDVALYRRLRHWVDRASAPGIRRSVVAYLCVFFGFSLYGSAETGQAAWQEARAREAVSVLPPRAFDSAGTAEAAIAERSLGLPVFRGEVDAFERVSPKEFVLGAWAFDPERPKQTLMLAAFCGTRLVGLAKPSRQRPTLAGLPGLEATRGRRIGYRMRVPGTACEPGTSPVAVLIGPDSRLAVLTNAERPVAVSKAE